MRHCSKPNIEQFGSYCTTCGSETLGSNFLCPACKQNKKSSDGDVFTTLLPESSKANELRQWFLSKWYGHGGLAVRVDGIVAVHSKSQLQKYVATQRLVMSSRGDHQHGHHRPCLNERRLFYSQFLFVQCEFWTVGATSVSLCPVDTPCELCSIVRLGFSTANNSNLWKGVQLVGDPILHDGLNNNKLMSHSQHLTSESSSLSAAVKWREAKRRVCFVCRATLGKIGWTPSLPVPRDAPPCDSWAVDDGEISYLVENVDAVLPTYCIVFSVT